MRITALFCCSLLATTAVAVDNESAPAAGPADPAPPTAVAALGPASPVTFADLLGAAHGPLVEQNYNFSVETHQLEVSHARARHELLEGELAKLVDRRVLE